MQNFRLLIGSWIHPVQRSVQHVSGGERPGLFGRISIRCRRNLPSDEDHPCPRVTPDFGQLLRAIVRNFSCRLRRARAGYEWQKRQTDRLLRRGSPFISDGSRDRSSEHDGCGADRPPPPGGRAERVEQRASVRESPAWVLVQAAGDNTAPLARYSRIQPRNQFPKDHAHGVDVGGGSLLRSLGQLRRHIRARSANRGGRHLSYVAGFACKVRLACQPEVRDHRPRRSVPRSRHQDDVVVFQIAMDHVPSMCFRETLAKLERDLTRRASLHWPFTKALGESESI